MQRTLQNAYFVNYILISFPNSDANVIFIWISREALDCFYKCSFEETNMQSYFQQPKSSHLYVLSIPQIKHVQHWMHLHSLTILIYICCWFFLLTSSLFYHPGSKINFFFIFLNIPFYETSHSLSHFNSTIFFYLFSLLYFHKHHTHYLFRTMAFQIIFQLAFPVYLSHWSTDLIMMSP